MSACHPEQPVFHGAQHTVDDLLAAVPVCDAARADLRRRMAAPGRHYRGLPHLALLWTRHLALGGSVRGGGGLSGSGRGAGCRFGGAIGPGRRGGGCAGPPPH